MQTLLRYRSYAILTLIYTIALGGYVFYDRLPQPDPIEIIEPTVAPTLTPSPIHVHVAGAVKNPGVYVLSPESRIVQAVEAAGGMTADADERGVNLADLVRDGQQVYVPAQGEAPLPSPTPYASVQSQAISPTGNTDQQININAASAMELDTLPGIGPVYAQRIIDYRQTQGPFAEPAEIMKVKGIGPTTYEHIKERITVD
ncbi:MAG: hypothetical protein A2Y73_05360 [Chloroflexi bacterium RBG_13_56_8]|nr:MAG: hypothetical protein A2Y73_05360 [Chloroflexi bacterium RBG_13_56_8]